MRTNFYIISKNRLITDISAVGYSEERTALASDVDRMLVKCDP